MDLRGHGDSDSTFTRYGDQATAEDVAALVAELGGPAVVVGNSMGAAAAVLAAVDEPKAVTGIVLVAPFVRDPQSSLVSRLTLRLAMARPWAARAWRAYLPTLFAGRKPVDLSAHLDAVAASMRRPGYARAFHQTVRQGSHAAAEQALAAVRAPALVVMGQLDPDWPDPGAEARWIGDALSATVELVPDAGHYPQAQQPETTARAVRTFAESVTSRA
jgi:pimeloyl-ACP methyl ester carboxylesterase